MTFQEQVKAAHGLSRLEAEAHVESLSAGDLRFAGVIKILIDDHGAYAGGISAQQMASDHGKLAHCAGSLYAISVVMEQLRAASLRGTEAATPVPDQ